MSKAKPKTKESWQGKVVQGKKNVYILINKLGIGAYATVWMCYCKNENKLVAMKIFKPADQSSGKKETEIYNKFSKLGIRNTIKLYDKFEHNAHICLVFDLMIGSLYDMMKSGGCPGEDFHKGFPIDFVIKTTHAVLEALSDLHGKGVVHGDIKPENILLHGRTSIHDDIISKLAPKSSNKKIVEYILTVSKKIDIDDKHSDSDNDRSDSDDGTDTDTNNSLMSEDPDPIVCTDSEHDSDDTDDTDDTDGTDDDDDNNDNNDDNNDDNDDDDDNDDNDDDDDNEQKHKKKEHLEINRSYIDSPIVKLSDLGSCVELASTNKPTTIQTKYYRPPEIVLGLGYDGTCDIWALGCTAYEMITGRILFDPDDHCDMDAKRCIMHQIYATVGRCPDSMVDASPLKQVFYTDSRLLKKSTRSDSLSANDNDNDYDSHYDSHYSQNVWTEHFLRTKCDTIKKYLLLDLITDMLKPDPKKRITASAALKHPIFALFID